MPCWNNLPNSRVYPVVNCSHQPEISMKKLVLSLSLAALLAACASMAAAPTKVADGVLTGTNGMTLYTFDRDAAGSGKSVCNGQCAINWPPLMASATDAASGDYSIITRDDGAKQWAYKGQPLYFWIKDNQPGDKTGDGVNKVWHVIKP
jgi:predicted lipoprotein with Yx(FWY)xxD motif